MSGNFHSERHKIWYSIWSVRESFAWTIKWSPCEHNRNTAIFKTIHSVNVPHCLILQAVEIFHDGKILGLKDLTDLCSFIPLADITPKCVDTLERHVTPDGPVTNHQCPLQMRPSVITCVSRSSSAHKLPDTKHRSSPAGTPPPPPNWFWSYPQPPAVPKPNRCHPLESL